MNDITREKILRNWFNSLTLESKDLLLEVWNCTIADMANKDIVIFVLSVATIWIGKKC